MLTGICIFLEVEANLSLVKTFPDATLSIITDMCLPDVLEPASLEKILAVASRAEPKLTTLVRGVLERM